MKPIVMSPLNNGDVVIGFRYAPTEVRFNQLTFKLKSNGKIDPSFKLDSLPVFQFNKIQELSSNKYLVHRQENYNDEAVFYNLGTKLDINITDSNGKTLNQLIVNARNLNEEFHLVKVKIIDSTHYLLAFCRQTHQDKMLEKGDFYIYKLYINETNLNNIQPIYYRKLSEYSFIDFYNDGSWNIRIRDNKSDAITKIIYFNNLGLPIDSLKPYNFNPGFYPELKLLNNLKLTLITSEGRTLFERFSVFSNDGTKPLYEASDFKTMTISNFSKISKYNGFGSDIQIINDSLFWMISSNILFDNENKSSVSGFFRIKIKENKITSEPDQLNAKLFPNPTNGIASIELPFYYEDGLNGNILITDMTGKLMQKDSFTLLKYENLQFDFSKYNTGLYFIRIEVNGRIYYTKLIKS